MIPVVRSEGFSGTRHCVQAVTEAVCRPGTVLGMGGHGHCSEQQRHGPCSPENHFLQGSMKRECGARKEAAEEGKASTEVSTQRALEKGHEACPPAPEVHITDLLPTGTSHKRPPSSSLLPIGLLLHYLKGMMCMCRWIHFFGFHHST